MTARILMKQAGDLACLSKFLRRSQIRIIKFNQYSDSSDEDKKGALKDLLSRRAGRNTQLSQPKGRRDLPRKGLKSKQMDTEGIEPDLLDATKEVAKMTKAPKDTESDLLKKLRSLVEDNKSAKSDNTVQGEKPSMASLFSDMKIEKKPVFQVARQQAAAKEKTKQLSLEQKAFLENRAMLRRKRAMQSMEEQYVPTDLFGAPPLGVLTAAAAETAAADEEVGISAAEEMPSLTTWRRCQERELTMLSRPCPRNALEEFIEWTEEGKLWHFPIDNEQGLDYSDEKFHQHIFLENHVKDWCPSAGPVKHFMELVCVGLSKNPYMSLQYKINTIHWFRNYFEKQEINEILIHQGAWPDPSQKEI